MSWEVLEHDPLTKTTQYFVPSVDGTEFRIVTERDDGPLLEANAELLKDFDRTRWGEGAIHSRVPNIVLFDLMAKGIVGPGMDLDTPAFQRWANSSSNLWKVRRDRL